ncbi:hypothetical protein [Anaeromyxobacter paludicola]|uniref:DUF1565 domain-containing protein n=1 Tax=Anaeromyxobacter paludicola TaxID=2918171 RepID=A0ABN6N332_9BACT|nr:hypothetical protein [Anaeromyxobacter paludicola]BDG07602.1 hypothetical protein AMPC_07150 [Anaeromyxobacter paludicola]
MHSLRRFLPLLAVLLPGLALAQFRPASQPKVFTLYAPTAFYVDSVNGSDSNDGLKPSTALATIAAVKAKPLSVGGTVYLARGGYWREELSSLPIGTSVAAFGQGARPVLDGADVAANAGFTKTGGYTNVYQVTWTSSLADSAKTKISVWEDGARLVRATSIANCDATPGSFYAVVSGTGTDTVYVNAVGSTAVPSDGHLYEISRRNFGLSGAIGGTEVSVHTRRQGHNNGSLLNYGTARDCVAEDGTVHNFWNAGTAEDCIAWKNEGYASAGAATMFVTYSDYGDGGAVYRRCKAIASTPSGTLGFYFHTSGGSYKHARMVFEDCEAIGLSGGFSGINAARVLYLRCKTYRCTQGITSGADKVWIIGGVLNGYTYAADGTLMNRAVNPSASTTLVMRGVRIIARTASGALVWANGTVDVQRCTFVWVDTTGFPFVAIKTDTGSLTVKNNIFSGGRDAIQAAAGTTLSSDYNAFSANTLAVTWNGTYYSSVSAYVTASSQDTHSTTTAPTFAGQVRSGDTRTANGSADWALSAGADYEADYDLTALSLGLTNSAGY